MFAEYQVLLPHPDKPTTATWNPTGVGQARQASRRGRDRRLHDPTMDTQPRLILLHKHKTSGRVRFPVPALWRRRLQGPAGAGCAAGRGLVAEVQIPPCRRRARGGGAARPAEDAIDPEGDFRPWVDTLAATCRCCWAPLPASTRPLARRTGPAGASSRSPNPRPHRRGAPSPRRAHEHVLGWIRRVTRRASARSRAAPDPRDPRADVGKSLRDTPPSGASAT